jgi:hypothetical protein
VSFPDGTDGTCRYERLGPACHRFEYRYGDGAAMPWQHLTRPLENNGYAIEQQAQALAAACFTQATEAERRDYFARASEPTSGSRKADPSRYQFSAKRARAVGGRYALCCRVGERLIPVSPWPNGSRTWLTAGGSGPTCPR